MTIVQVYPKLVVDVDSTLTEREVFALFDQQFYDGAKTKLRQVLQGRGTITRWHYHLPTGSVDEVER